MPFITCNKTLLKVAVQSLPSFKASKSKFDYFIKQWQHQELVTSRLGAEGRGTKRAKRTTQPSHSDNRKNTHYELGDHNSFSILLLNSTHFQTENSVSPKTKPQRLWVTTDFPVSREIMLDPVWIQM